MMIKQSIYDMQPIKEGAQITAFASIISRMVYLHLNFRQFLIIINSCLSGQSTN